MARIMTGRPTIHIVLLSLLIFFGIYLIVQPSLVMPPSITQEYPADGSSGVTLDAELAVSVAGLNGGLMNVTFFGRERSNGNFTIIVLPDTQYYSKLYPRIFDNQTRWIAENAAKLNVAFVVHEGDIVDDWDNATQWENANRSLSVLDGLVPYSIAPGNHDMENRLPGGDTGLYNAYFPASRYDAYPWWGASFGGGSSDNSYKLFSAGGQDFLILHLEYQASNAVLGWANGLLKTYLNRSAIIVTHDYMNVDSGLTYYGRKLWDNLIFSNKNVFLVLAGHNHGEAMRTDPNAAGRPVLQLLSDYQEYNKRASGLLRAMEFSPSEGRVYVSTFSPYLGQAGCAARGQEWTGKGCFETDDDSSFSVDYFRFNEIGSVAGVSGGKVTSEWNDRSPATGYEWLAEGVDWQSRSYWTEVWGFSTVNQSN